ncbi:hypothetical protein Bca4012_027324 [Brassica carinata]|uniref:Uncharacterized protein n=1 Tax=Brassica carinata TaxID=52824 RepID=A0A8X7VJX4_BRACI|nr:hypothetical protein Bca52824_024321 [Brassica carinata]
MLDKLIGGYGYGHKNHRSSGYTFEEHKEFMSYEASEGGYFDRQARYNHHMRIPANYGRPPMAHMPAFDEDDSDLDVEEFYKSGQSHQTTVLPHHGNNHHQQPPHMNFMPPPPMAQPHHNGKKGNGWQGMHEDAYYGGHGMQQHGGHGMKHQDKLMTPQVPPHHVYLNPSHGSGSGHAVMFKASENWRVSNSGSRHHMAGWGNRRL